MSFVNPFGAPKPLPILNPSNFIPNNRFPVVKGSSVKLHEPEIIIDFLTVRPVRLPLLLCLLLSVICLLLSVKLHEPGIIIDNLI